MVVSGGSKHALTVLWMGRWFSGSLISVSPLQETDTRWRNINHGGRILAWYTRLSSPEIFVKIASLFVRSLAALQLCSRVLSPLQLSATIRKMWTVLIAGFCTVSDRLLTFPSFVLQRSTL